MGVGVEVATARGVRVGIGTILPVFSADTIIVALTMMRLIVSRKTMARCLRG